MKRLPLASVLILENEELIVLDVEHYLRQTGYEIAASYPCGSEALHWLKRNRADVAILDIGLRDGEATEVAHVLRQRDIPFVVYSGNRYEPDFHDPVFLTTQWITKPCSSDTVIAAVRYALSGMDATRSLVTT